MSGEGGSSFASGTASSSGGEREALEVAIGVSVRCNRGEGEE